MPKYNIAVCDDVVSETEQMSKHVSLWASIKKYSIQVTSFQSAEQLLFQYEERPDYDILLLDIEMDGISGVELAKRIRKENRTVQIIFVTAYSDYILDGYEVEALHYLMKPVSRQKLFEVLDRAVEKLSRSEQALFLQTTQGLIRVPLHTIRWLEVQQNYVTIHADAEHQVKRPLMELEQELDEQFFRTGRSFIVNMKYITRVTKTDVYLKDGTAIPLSRGLYDKLNRAIIQYF